MSIIICRYSNSNVLLCIPTWKIKHIELLFFCFSEKMYLSTKLNTQYNHSERGSLGLDKEGGDSIENCYGNI